MLPSKPCWDQFQRRTEAHHRRPWNASFLQWSLVFPVQTRASLEPYIISMQIFLTNVENACDAPILSLSSLCYPLLIFHNFNAISCFFYRVMETLVYWNSWFSLCLFLYTQSPRRAHWTWNQLVTASIDPCHKTACLFTDCIALYAIYHPFCFTRDWWNSTWFTYRIEILSDYKFITTSPNDS